MSIILLTTREAVEPYIDAVAKAADSERDSFGFLPDGAYRELAYQNRMYVAVDARSKALAGYVLFGGIMPQGKILQTYVSPVFRGKSVGGKLVRKVVETLEASYFLSLRADVASHLANANAFYGKLGFDTINVKPARTKGRTINVRVRELATPSLLDLALSESERGCALPVSAPAQMESPLFLVDLNVLFDTAKRRPRSEETGRVFGMGFEQHITLAVAAELISELERNTPSGKPDPILEFARTLPRLPTSPAAVALANDVNFAALVFPDQTRDDCLSPQDRSDLRHLATAITECASGFITSEKAILKASQALKDRYNLEIFSPDAFGQGFAISIDAGNDIVLPVGECGITVHEVTAANWALAEALLIRLRLDGSRLRTALSSGTTSLPRRRYIACVDGRTIAFSSWDAPKGSVIARDLYLFADEGDPHSASAVEYLIQKAARDVGGSSPGLLKITPHGGQPTVRRVAITTGFRGTPRGVVRHAPLEKICLGRAILPADWASFAQLMDRRVGIRLQDSPPFYEGVSQPVALDTNQGSIVLALGDLEALLSPAIFALEGRSGVILPIRAGYAEELFRGSAQPSFLANSQAILVKDRGYIGGAGSYRIIPEGGLAIFYESGDGNGRKCATAVARIKKRYLMDKAAASEFSSVRGVVKTQQIQEMGRSKQVTVTEFDNIMLFQNPVSLSKLRELGCADGANFVTARALSASGLQAILEAGRPHV